MKIGFSLRKAQVKQIAILNLFSGKSPTDTKIHGFAQKHNMPPDKFEMMVYSIINAFMGGGKAKEKGVTEKDVDQHELALGEKVEMEHLNSKNPFAKYMARRIALDHLAEAKDWKDPKYYSHGLSRMESSMKGGKNES